MDCSALIRLYIPDGPVPNNVEQAVEQAWQGDDVLLGPELLLAEAMQVLWRKQQRGLLSATQVDDIAGAILDLPLEIAGHRPLLPEARALAQQHRLTVYEALYLALAQAHRATLLTADAALQKAANHTP
ncbi:MAG: type II toxin-antitoxin system VapC family toxin [Polyangiales bacterium]